MYGFLYKNYKPKFFYWEFVRMIGKNINLFIKFYFKKFKLYKVFQLLTFYIMIINKKKYSIF